jgi:Mg2+/Co2+ transporter CorB
MMAINRYRLKALSNQNNTQAKRTERLLSDLDHLIGTILLGNNFVNIFASSIATILAIKLWGEGSIVYASIPPPVEPAQAPIKLAKINNIGKINGH